MVSPIPLYQLTCRISVAWNPCNFGHADDDQITFLHSAALAQGARSCGPLISGTSSPSAVDKSI